MAVGQYIYNLTDYNNKGVFWSTNKSETDIISSLEENYETNKINIFREEENEEPLLANIDNIIHLGIQAPPGTKFIFTTGKDTKECIMGNTGVFELDEESILSYGLRFLKNMKYKLDDEEMAKAALGKDEMNTAKTNFETAVKKLDENYPIKDDNGNPIKDDEYWKEYHILYVDYTTKYNEAYKLYEQYLNGIYVEDKPEDLFNIIIDYITKEK